MKKFLFLSILCYACNVVYGQHYIPVKKMISNYKEQKAIDTLKNHDIIYNIEESPEAGIFMEQSLLPSDLQRPKDIHQKKESRMKHRSIRISWLKNMEKTI